MKKLFYSLVFYLLSFLLILLPFSFGSYAANDVDWLLLKKNSFGEQWIDRGSIKEYPNNEISILTRFFETPKEPETKVKNFFML